MYSLNGQGLPGLGGATQAAIPKGTVGKPTIAAFQPTAGMIHTCNYYLDTALIPPTRREGALLSGHYAFDESADVFTEILLSNEFQKQHRRRRRAPAGRILRPNHHQRRESLQSLR